MYNNGATVPGNVYEEERPPPPPYNPNPTCPPYDFVKPQQTNNTYNQHVKSHGTPPSGAPPSTALQPSPGSVQYRSAESNQKDGSDTGRIVIVTQEAPKNAAVPVQQSFTIHYVLSCLAFWLCGFLFGGIAFGLAVFARRKADEGDKENAKQFSIASLALSVVGFVTGCILWGFIIYYIVETCLTDDSCNYKCEGTCYSHQDSALELEDCWEHGRNSCMEDGYCFYNDH